MRNHAGQRGVPTPSSILATPPRPTAPVHGPPPLPPLRIRQTVGRARETVYARAKTRTACTTTINRPINRHESFDRNRERSNVLVSSRRPCAICPLPPSSSPARARTYRPLSPPPCSLSLLSRCLTFFPLHHLILRPDPFPPARSLFFLRREDFASRFDR